MRSVEISFFFIYLTISYLLALFIHSDGIQIYIEQFRGLLILMQTVDEREKNTFMLMNTEN